jgi:hypothetical protein
MDDRGSVSAIKGITTAMEIYTYTAAQSEAAECPFGDKYSKDLSVYYHGTSCHTEEAIDREGFAWNGNTYTLEEIESVNKVFDQLHWAGCHTGGFTVLGSFTMSDFKHGRNVKNKGISFAGMSDRAILHASKEWAGGETARALRFAFEDLCRYLEDPEFRQAQILHSWEGLRDSISGATLPRDCVPQSPEKICFGHIHKLWNFYASLGVMTGMGGRSPVEPADFSPDWLRGRVEELQPLRDRVYRLTAEYRYGVVYAVRLNKEDQAKAIKRSNFELYIKHVLPPQRIIAKAVIPAEAGYNQAHRDKKKDLALAISRLTAN